MTRKMHAVVNEKRTIPPTRPPTHARLPTVAADSICTNRALTNATHPPTHRQPRGVGIVRIQRRRQRLAKCFTTVGVHTSAHCCGDGVLQVGVAVVVLLRVHQRAAVRGDHALESELRPQKALHQMLVGAGRLAVDGVVAAVCLTAAAAAAERQQ